MAPPEKRSRALSLSLDWDNVLSGGLSKEDRHLQSTLEEKPPVKFCTNSTYAGQWDALGMAGFGTYQFPHGTKVKQIIEYTNKY